MTSDRVMLLPRYFLGKTEHTKIPHTHTYFNSGHSELKSDKRRAQDQGAERASERVRQTEGQNEGNGR